MLAMLLETLNQVTTQSNISQNPQFSKTKISQKPLSRDRMLLSTTYTLLLSLALTEAIYHEGLYKDFGCYQCETNLTHEKAACIVVDDKPELLVVCPKAKNYCLKKVLRRFNFLYIERGCTDLYDDVGTLLKVGCMFMRNEGDEELTLCLCDLDQCNGGRRWKCGGFWVVMVGLVLLLA